ncbi:MAG: hypothetical protein WAN81_14360 [Candidatus Binataceae bacterium]
MAPRPESAVGADAEFGGGIDGSKCWYRQDRHYNGGAQRLQAE